MHRKSPFGSRRCQPAILYDRFRVPLEPKKDSYLQNRQNQEERIFFGIVTNIGSMQDGISVESTRCFLALIEFVYMNALNKDAWSWRLNNNRLFQISRLIVGRI